MSKKKRTYPLTLEEAVQMTITVAAETLNEDGFRPFAVAYSISENGTCKSYDMAEKILNPDDLAEVVDSGFKGKGVYVIVLITNPTDDNCREFIVASYDKSRESTLSRAPYQIRNNKIYPMVKSEKGFGIFFED